MTAVVAGPGRWERFWFPALPIERWAVFSRVVHGTVLFTVFRTDRWVADHAFAPRSFWQPVAVARAVHLPAPTPGTMVALQVVIAVAALAAVVGVARTPGAARAVNAVVAGGYLVWVLWAFSFSKVDHDRLTIVVALALLVAVPGRGRGPDPVAGWALRVTQVVFLLAYPLSAAAKLRKSGWSWTSSAVFARAIVRRGSSLGDHLVDRPGLLRAGQWVFLVFEMLAVAALVRRLQPWLLAGVVGLHLFTYAAIGIHFLPHTICIVSFLPLERLHPGVRRDARSAQTEETGDAAAVVGGVTP